MHKKSLSLIFCCALIISAGCIDAPGELTLEEDTTSAAELELELVESELVESGLAESELPGSELPETELPGAELFESDWGSEAEWHCQGWDPPKFQHCLTRCTQRTTLHPVGSEHDIPYGTCHERADSHCRNRGWGWAYNVCWGAYY